MKTELLNQDSTILSEEMYQIHVFLNRYIKIHDKIFKFSLRKIIPIPGLFRPIDFKEQFNELDSIVSEMEQFDVFKCSKAEVCSVFTQYANALLKTIKLLRDICSRLYDVSRGDSQDYRIDKYNADLTTYKALVQEYRSLGSTLNVCIRK